MSNRHTSAAILITSLLHFCEGFIFVTHLMVFKVHTSEALENVMVFGMLFWDGLIFVTCLMGFRVHTFDTLEKVTTSERPYSGVNFELQFRHTSPAK